MKFKNSVVVILTCCLNVVVAQKAEHPRIYTKASERTNIINKIETEAWAKASWGALLQDVDVHVNRHVTNPEWMVSRLAMYWKEGERYTQCYIKNQDWDYGEGNAPLPTVRLPGMRRWNDFVNVPLEDRIPYNESGDMLGVSRSSGDKTPVLIPYKESGHMIRANNMEILKLAEKSAFAYYITQEEKYAKFSADIFWTWILGIYYMQPPLDPEKSSKGTGGYAPGGILGYYDYEVIHDDRQIPAASIYDFLFNYLLEHPHTHLKTINKKPVDIAGTVFKRFIEIGLVRGGKKGNWNVNRYKNLLGSMLVLESNTFYEDGKGREYYIPFYTEKSGEHFAGLPEIMANYNTITGLWPESPGYASGMIPYVLDMGLKLYKSDINTLSGNPIVTKAALANLGWLDARGNLVLFGDMRGGPPNMSAFESLLTYATWEKDEETAKKMAMVIRKNITSGYYDRSKSDWQGIIFNQPLPESGDELPYHKAAYSPFHRHLIMKNGNDEENGLMFTLYGGRYQSHLGKNGLAMQFYGKGWAMSPDASGYESYWSKDAGYHRGITGSNTIVPGYKDGDITINAMEPWVDTSKSLYNSTSISENVSFADVSADEKRRLVAMVRTSDSTGYYVDIFRSDQNNNDYIHHNLGNSIAVKDKKGKMLQVQPTKDLGMEYDKNYSFFTNQHKIKFSDDFYATWKISNTNPSLFTDMWMMGQNNREIYTVTAPPTTLRSDITPEQVNKSPENTPTLIVRQNGLNGKEHPFVSVFESYQEGEKSIKKIEANSVSKNFISLHITSENSKQQIFNAIDDEVYKPSKKINFKGTFGVISETDQNLEYMYLGKGKLLQKGEIKLEAIDEAVSAELYFKEGSYFYSSDKPIYIKIGKEKAKIYPAGSTMKME